VTIGRNHPALAKVRVAAETGDAAVPRRRSERRWRVVDRIGEQATRGLLREAGAGAQGMLFIRGRSQTGFCAAECAFSIAFRKSLSG
jgi:hypothetical protein